jgi:hypothetical protein
MDAADVGALPGAFAMSTWAFLEGVVGKTYPAPVQEGRRKLWARAQLDRFVESQFGIAQPSEDGSWDDMR